MSPITLATVSTIADPNGSRSLPRTTPFVFTNAASSNVLYIERGNERLELQQDLPAGTILFRGLLAPIDKTESHWVPILSRTVNDHQVQRYKENLANVELCESTKRNQEAPRLHRHPNTVIFRHPNGQVLTVATRIESGYVNVLHLANEGVNGFQSAFTALNVVKKDFPRECWCPHGL